MMTESGLGSVARISLASDLSGALKDQHRVVAAIAAGRGGSMPSPFLAMLDAPNLADAIQRSGVELRYGSSLDPRQRELAILSTARAQACLYEWDDHLSLARAAGTPEDAIEASSNSPSLSKVDEPRRTFIAATREMTLRHRLSDVLLNKTVSLPGRRGTTEPIAIAGYYALLANFIPTGGRNADRAD